MRTAANSMSRYCPDPTATPRGRIVYDRPRWTGPLWLATGGALLAGITLWPDDGAGGAVTAELPTRVAAVAAETLSHGAPAAATAASMPGAAWRLLPWAQL